MHISKGAPFAFRQRRERIDWRKIASVDVDRVARNVDFQTLQDNTSNVTFCDVQAELEPNSLDPNFMKLFRLAQLIIEYLLYSQDCLSSALSSQEQQLLEKTKQIEDLKEKLEKHRAKHKKADGKPSYIILDSSGGQFQCSSCPKVFMNEAYLRMHVQRRHPEHSAIVSVEDPGLSNALEKELLIIKEQLKITESRLLEQKTALENASVKEQIEVSRRESDLRQEMENWKLEQVESHRKELNSVREQFLNELKFLNEKCLNSEKQLHDLKQQAEFKQHSVALIDEENHAHIVRRHQEEMIQMKEQMKDQMEKVGNAVQQEFKEKEKLWKMNLQQLEREHSEEIHKLNDALYTKLNTVPASQAHYPTDKEIILTRQIETLEELNRKQNQKLVNREKRFQEISNYSPVKYQSTPKHNVVQPQHDLEVIKKVTKHHSLDDIKNTTVPPIAKIESVVRHNPYIIQGMREEVCNLLEEKLERIGIPRSVDGVKDSTLNNKLASQQSEQRSLTKKYTNLLSLREQLHRQVEWIAQSQIKRSKTVPSTPPRAKKSFRKLFSSMREKVKSVATRSRSHSPRVPSHRISLNVLGSTQDSNAKTSSVDSMFDHHVDDEKDDHELSTNADSSGDDSELRSIGYFAREVNKNTVDSKEDEDDASESEDLSLGPFKTPTLIVTTLPTPAPRIAIHRSPSVAQLAASLEQQLEGRKVKPLGGVDLMRTKEVLKDKPRKNEHVVAAKQDQYSNRLSLSLEDIFNATSKNSYNKPLTLKGETENSSNTGATSVWGGSAFKQTESGKHTSTLSRPTSSLVSVSSWDSENDISELS